MTSATLENQTFSPFVCSALFNAHKGRSLCRRILQEQYAGDQGSESRRVILCMLSAVSRSNKFAGDLRRNSLTSTRRLCKSNSWAQATLRQICFISCRVPRLFCSFFLFLMPIFRGNCEVQPHFKPPRILFKVSLVCAHNFL